MARTLPPSAPNLFERAISSIAPGWALRRHKARMAMSMSGGYAGAAYNERMAAWQPGVGDADGDTVRDLRALRGRSRDLTRNSPIAGGALETEVTHVIGSGLTMQSRIDAKLLGLDEAATAEWQRNTERGFSLWGASTYCDVNDELDFGELQELIYRTGWESGDAPVILANKPRPGWPYRLALQVIEADRVCNPRFAADTTEMVAGVERDTSGAPVALQVCNRHPGAGGTATAGFGWTRISLRGASGRRNVLIWKRKLRPGQTRGIPALAPIIATLKQMARLADAEIDAAVNAAAMALFVKMDPDAFSDLLGEDAQEKFISAAQGWDGGLPNGRAVNLLPGEEVVAPAPGRPNPNFDPFMSAFLGYVGMGLNIPKEVLAKAFQASYSAARAALMDAWRTFMVRRTRFARRVCQPIYEEWLSDEVAAGRLAAPGFFADPLIRAAWCGARWSGDGPGALDPLKEAKAMRERMDIGVTTLADETVAYDGGDWEDKHLQRVREVAERIEGGLQAPTTPTTSPPAGAAPATAPTIPPVDDSLDADEPGSADD